MLLANRISCVHIKNDLPYHKLICARNALTTGFTVTPQVGF